MLKKKVLKKVPAVHIARIKTKAKKKISKSVTAIHSCTVDKNIEKVASSLHNVTSEFLYASVSVCKMDELDNAISSSSEDQIADVIRQQKRESKTIFDMDMVEDPLTGTPIEVRKELDALALKLQRHPKDQAVFLKIACYMHKYILGLVFKKYNYIRGYDNKDIYQEALIALFKKAVPSFKKGKGMSFLNFAKMCINRHLITMLNTSRNRKKDMPLNTSISLDHSPLGNNDDDDACVLSNIIPDTVHGQPPFTTMTKSETFDRTFQSLMSLLSPFEQAVLTEYLQEKSYREASRSVSKIYGKRCNERSIDNALLRIRKKAQVLKNELGEDALPLVFGNIES